MAHSLRNSLALGVGLGLTLLVTADLSRLPAKSSLQSRVNLESERASKLVLASAPGPMNFQVQPVSAVFLYSGR